MTRVAIREEDTHQHICKDFPELFLVVRLVRTHYYSRIVVIV